MKTLLYGIPIFQILISAIYFIIHPSFSTYSKIVGIILLFLILLSGFFVLIFVLKQKSLFLFIVSNVLLIGYTIPGFLSSYILSHESLSMIDAIFTFGFIVLMVLSAILGIIFGVMYTRKFKENTVIE